MAVCVFTLILNDHSFFHGAASQIMAHFGRLLENQLGQFAS